MINVLVCDRIGGRRGINFHLADHGRKRLRLHNWFVQTNDIPITFACLKMLCCVDFR